MVGVSASGCSKRTNRAGEGVNTLTHALLALPSKCSCIQYVIESSSRHERAHCVESRSRIPSSFSPSLSCGCVSGPVTPFHSKSRCSGRHCVDVSGRTSFHLPPLSLTSDSIFLLGGVVNVVLFCTIRRVIPVKEVVKGIFTGKVFRKREDEPTDSTWCIGTLEVGEKDDVSIVASDDYFALRQPKFEIITPPQVAVPLPLPDQPVAEPTTQTAPTFPVPRTEDAISMDAPKIPPLRIHRKPLPIEPSIHDEEGDGSDSHTSFSPQSSLRKLPTVPPKSAPLRSITENGDSPPPPYLPGGSHHRYSVSISARSHSYAGSYDSVVSDTPLLRGPRPPEKK